MSDKASFARNRNRPLRDVHANDLEPTRGELGAKTTRAAADIENPPSDPPKGSPFDGYPLTARREVVEPPDRDVAVVALDDLERAPTFELLPHERAERVSDDHFTALAAASSSPSEKAPSSFVRTMPVRSTTKVNGSVGRFHLSTHTFTPREGSLSS